MGTTGAGCGAGITDDCRLVTAEDCGPGGCGFGTGAGLARGRDLSDTWSGGKATDVLPLVDC
jgi:hypothetical protein